CSLRQCIKVLKDYDTCIIYPKGLDIDCYHKISDRLHFRYIDPYWTTNIHAYNRLLKRPLLYRMFSSYEFILVHQLDAFVFRDELSDWCQKGFDYVGAPWFDGFGACTEDSPFIGVGNGGLSLRNTKSALRVLRSLALRPARVREKLSLIKSAILRRPT